MRNILRRNHSVKVGDTQQCQWDLGGAQGGAHQKSFWRRNLNPLTLAPSL